MKPHDDRFNTAPAMGPADPKDYPKGMKPGDPGFIEALLAEDGLELKVSDALKDKG